METNQQCSSVMQPARISLLIQLSTERNESV